MSGLRKVELTTSPSRADGHQIAWRYDGMADNHGEKTLMPKCVDGQATGEPVTYMPLWGSCRLVYTMCAFFTMFNLILLRFNLSFALVCMVRGENQTQFNNTTSSEDCPMSSVSEENVENQVVGEFEWTKMQQGRILSAFFYGYIVSQGFGGWFSDKFGGKMPFILGNMLQSIITLLLPVASRFHPEALFGCRVAQGIVCGLSLPSLFQLYTRWASPKERTALMGIAYSGFPIANVVIFPLSGVLCQYGFDGGWPSIFYITGLFGLSCSVVFCFLVYDDADSHPRISEKERRYLKGCTLNTSSKPMRVPWKAILISKPVYAYHITHFCYSWGFITLAANLPLFMKEVLYFDLSENGFLSALPYLGMLGMRIIISSSFAPVQNCTGFSLTKLRKINHTIGTIGAGVCMLLVTVLTCRDQYLAVALITIGQSVSDLAFTGGYLLTYLDLAPQYAGLLTGISNTIGSLSGVIAPTLVGMLTPNGTREEWMLVMYITTAFYFLGAAVYLAFGTSELQPWAREQDDPKDIALPELRNSLLNEK